MANGYRLHQTDLLLLIKRFYRTLRKKVKVLCLDNSYGNNLLRMPFGLRFDWINLAHYKELWRETCAVLETIGLV